jgi:hypothetical protein
MLSTSNLLLLLLSLCSIAAAAAAAAAASASPSTADKSDKSGKSGKPDKLDVSPPIISYSSLVLLSSKKTTPTYTYTSGQILTASLSMGVNRSEWYEPSMNVAKDGLEPNDMLRDLIHKRSHGLFYLKDCGYLCKLKPSEIERVLGLIFNDGTRSDSSVSTTSHENRGYIPPGGESGSSSYVEAKEGFAYGSRLSSTNSTNKWPPSLMPGDVELLERVYSEASSITSLLLTDVFMPYINQRIEQKDDGDSNGGNGGNKRRSVEVLKKRDIEDGARDGIMRIFNYLPCNASNANFNNTMGSSPHTDWGLLTLILQSQSPTSLYYNFNTSGTNQTWHPVPSIRNTVVINCGDFLRLMSEVNHMEHERGQYSAIERTGTILSPLHKVQHCDWSRGVEEEDEKKEAAKSVGVSAKDGEIEVFEEEDEKVNDATTEAPSMSSNRWSFVFFSYPSYNMDVTKITKRLEKKGREGYIDYNTLTGGGFEGVTKFGEWIEKKWKTVGENGVGKDETEEVVIGGAGLDDGEVAEIGIDGDVIA